MFLGSYWKSLCSSTVRRQNALTKISNKACFSTSYSSFSRNTTRAKKNFNIFKNWRWTTFEKVKIVKYENKLFVVQFLPIYVSIWQYKHTYKTTSGIYLDIYVLPLNRQNIFRVFQKWLLGKIICRQIILTTSDLMISCMSTSHLMSSRLLHNVLDKNNFTDVNYSVMFTVQSFKTSICWKIGSITSIP